MIIRAILKPGLAFVARPSCSREVVANPITPDTKLATHIAKKKTSRQSLA
jgi:hypothetical protein